MAVRDVEGDSRRVRILAKYVLEEFDGQLPRQGDVAELAGWEHEDADLAQVKVGHWWHNFSRQYDGARKKRVEESAPDEATKKALQYLAQCKVRDKENAMRDVKGDSRRVRIFAKYVREECHGRLPRHVHRAELAGWEREGAVVARVQVGRWWYDFSIKNDGARKKRVEESARDEATQQALRDLAQCKKRNVRDVEGDSRRVRIFAKYVHEECHGRLPRVKDRAELAGWEQEGAGVAQVKVGQWWYLFSIKNDGARKKRVEESARDEATQQALRDLAQCEKRDEDTRCVPRCDVEGDSRRVRIFAKYVREECHGRLPRTNDLAELAGWEREGAGVARVKVGLWWYHFSSMNDGARKKRVEESTRDEETQQVLRDLAQCEKRNVRDVEGDSRRVRIFAKYVHEECGGRLPRQTDLAALAGWEREGADVAQVKVGQWWYHFSIKNDGARKKRVEESARDEETQQALRDLAQCEKRDEDTRCVPRCDVEGDSRRVRIFAKYVHEECGGRLPRTNDLAELAGWEREDADVAQVAVGHWWYRFSIKNDGARKKHVEESACDEATQQALRDLAQCEKRDEDTRCVPRCDVEGDSRRVRIFAKYVREECHGRLPRQTDLAELAGWKREGAGVAQVKVGLWWHTFSIKNDGARKKRVEESARDEATQQALRDLAQCEKRNKDTRWEREGDVEGDSRRVRIFAKYVREECRGRLPRTNDLAELAGWKREGAGVAQVKVGRWWYNFSRHNGGERKKRVEESARDEETQQALRDLAQCEKQDHGNSDVEGDSRRVRIFAKYVREECRGRLPREKDRAELAGWEREDADVAQVPVGKWWSTFSRQYDGARKKRVEESARDEETQQALRDLAQCDKRDKDTRRVRRCDVEGDSRRVRIFAKYVHEECGGRLPRACEVAELAGWKREDADIAQVRVGSWWNNFSRQFDGARKKRVEESARDEATQQALRDLAQCDKRDSKRFKRQQT